MPEKIMTDERIEARRLTQLKYREKNKAILAEKQKKYIAEHPEYREKARIRASKYYYAKKAEKAEKKLISVQ